MLSHDQFLLFLGVKRTRLLVASRGLTRLARSSWARPARSHSSDYVDLEPASPVLRIVEDDALDLLFQPLCWGHQTKPYAVNSAYDSMLIMSYSRLLRLFLFHVSVEVFPNELFEEDAESSSPS